MGLWEALVVGMDVDWAVLDGCEAGAEELYGMVVEPKDGEVDDWKLEAVVEAAAAWCALVREVPLPALVGEVLAFWNPERGRKAERKFERKGRFVVMAGVQRLEESGGRGMGWKVEI